MTSYLKYHEISNMYGDLSYILNIPTAIFVFLSFCLTKNSAVFQKNVNKKLNHIILNRRIRTKYENEIKELEHSERTTHEKCTALKNQVEQMENECIRMKSDSKSKEQQVADVQKLLESLQSERGKVTNIVRQEFADR